MLIRSPSLRFLKYPIAVPVLSGSNFGLPGVVDTAELLSKLEDEIAKVQGERASRKDIMIQMEKWMTACEEEGWLEDYNKVLDTESYVIQLH